jgi:hypothetical protein
MRQNVKRHFKDSSRRRTSRTQLMPAIGLAPRHGYNDSVTSFINSTGESGTGSGEFGIRNAEREMVSRFPIPDSPFPIPNPRNITVPQNIVVGTRRKYASPSAFDFSPNRINPIIAIFARRRMRSSNVAQQSPLSIISADSTSLLDPTLLAAA